MSDLAKIIGFLIAIPIILFIGYWVIGIVIWLIPFLLGIGVIGFAGYAVFLGIGAFFGKKS